MTVFKMLQSIFVRAPRSHRDCVGRHEFEQLGTLTRQAMDRTLELDARLRVLEGRAPRPNPAIDPEDG